MIKVHIDTVKYNMKPKKEFGLIKPRLQSESTIQEVEVKELISKITNGYSISPAIMNGGISELNWKEQSLFMVDIDNDNSNLPILTLEEALNICKNNSIVPAFSYYTFSHTEQKPKYRLAFITDIVITNSNDRKKIINTLISLFPQCDEHCKNADRIFLGTNNKKFIYNENATISITQINNIVKSKISNNFNNIKTLYEIPEGMRNKTLFISACKLAEQNLNYEEILSLIKKENNEKCISPLSNKEISTLVNSAIKHINNIPPFIYRTTKNNKVYYNVSSQLLAQHIRNTANYFLVKNDSNERTMIYWYNNGVYKNINEDMLKGYIKSYIQSFDMNLYKSTIVNEVFKDLTTDLNFISQDELNNNENIINFKNGLYDIQSKKLIPHTPDIYTTIQIPCNWNNDTNINAPIFMSYIDKLTDYNEDKKSLLLQFMGACFSNIKGYRFKKALFLVGNGDTGKSQLKNLVEKILGNNNYTSIDLTELESRFGTSMLYNKRLAGSNDMSFADVKELKQFKKITGGDSIFTEFKGCQGFHQTYYGLLWFCCNKLPKFSGDSGQWVYDRIAIIKCKNVIPKDKQDKYLLEKMYNERESIVKLALKELELSINNGYEFVISDEIKKESILYKQNNSSVASFINDCCTKRSNYNDNCSCGKMYNVYIEYCKYNNNGYHKSQKEFKNELIELSGYEPNAIIKRTNTNTFYVPYTITLETYINYNKIYGYSDYFEKQKNSMTN